eukprot:TRINITY_DN36278_c0_g1_i1.p1 TRINITY_DN36278_c0_g1~~TRINITY_DN36278_c0_g1_i1.p1  ORF type:complete len:677 (+),score=116.36 TRINITY_DN36278_c0_g1_i1:99-2129(+)
MPGHLPSERSRLTFPAQQQQPRVSDAALEQFLRKGYLLIRPGGSPQLHSTIYAKAAAIHASGPHATWQLADGVLQAIPELNQVLESLPIRQAVSSVLGDGYLLHAHRHLHVSSGVNQMWHKDSYWGFRKVRRHRPRWCMLLYYPQDTVLSMGPTCVLAGSQYWTKDTEGSICGEDILVPNSRKSSMFVPSGDAQSQARHLQEAKMNYLNSQHAGLIEEVPLVVPAGSCVLMHYELFHRASCRQADSDAPERFMVKFQFLRTSEPAMTHSSPSLAPTSPNLQPQVDPIVENIRRWLQGRQEAPWTCAPQEVAKDAEVLMGWSNSEVDRVAAAYRLARVRALPVLLHALQASQEGVARAAAYGLSAAGPSAASALLPLLKVSSARVRRLAAFALGESACPDAVSITALGEAISQEVDEGVASEMLDALALIAGRARACGMDALCNLSVQLALPRMMVQRTPGCKTQVGESAALVLLMAGGLHGQVTAAALATLKGIADAGASGCDHIMVHFATEVLRRNALASLALPTPCHAPPGLVVHHAPMIVSTSVSSSCLQQPATRQSPAHHISRSPASATLYTVPFAEQMGMVPVANRHRVGSIVKQAYAQGRVWPPLDEETDDHTFAGDSPSRWASNAWKEAGAETPMTSASALDSVASASTPGSSVSLASHVPAGLHVSFS